MRAWLPASVVVLVGCGRSPTVETIEVACSDDAVPILSCDDPCGDVRYGVQAAVPNVLLTLDRSCSMEPRWPSAIEALRRVVTLRADDVHWGLSVFPDRDLGECQQGDILVPVGTGNGQRIPAMLAESLDPMDAMYPSGPCPTNITSGIGQAATDPAFDQVGPQKIVILMTDGWQTCGGEDGGQGAIDLLEKIHEKYGIRTYVISFGNNVSDSTLEHFAAAGGTARDEGIAYYIATENLAEIIDEILGGLRCDYGLDIAEDEVDRLRVTFDGVQDIPRDGNSGWTYDARRKALAFHGASCAMLQDRGLRVDFTLGC
jgi:hypothetical protein